MNNELLLKKYSGSMLRNLRIERNMTQQALADAVTNLKKSHHDSSIVTRQTISKYENGERGMNLEMISDLSIILKIPVNYFFPNPTTLEDAMVHQTKNLFTKTILDDEGFSLEIKTPMPFDQLSLEEQKEIMNSAMEEFIKLKNKF